MATTLGEVDIGLILHLFIEVTLEVTSTALERETPAFVNVCVWGRLQDEGIPGTGVTAFQRRIFDVTGS